MKQKSDRNRAIYEDRQKGLTFVAIGKKWGISRVRAVQIYRKALWDASSLDEKREYWRNEKDKVLRTFSNA
jgi:hypothetical protein